MTAPRADDVRELLARLARAPRPAGSVAEAEAQEHAAAVLRRSGFAVRREPFAYSAFPGRYGTPVGGAFVGITVLASASLGLASRPYAAALTLTAGVLLSGVFSSAMLGNAVLLLPWCRAESANLVATRGDAVPRVWLVAHSDSKSQPVPSLVRMAGVLLLLASLVGAVVAAVLQLAWGDGRTMWMIAALCALAGALPVVASVVRARSHGALDNASGMVAVIAAASRVRREVALGVLIPSAEELGLAGARQWVRTMAPHTGVAINCDGVDDEGTTMLMYSGRAPRPLIDAMRGVGAGPLHVRRLPIGLLTDSVALADGGWRTVTVSRGSFRTLGRVHTPSDSLDNLRGDAIDDVATLLARAVEALA